MVRDVDVLDFVVRILAPPAFSFDDARVEHDGRLHATLRLGTARAERAEDDRDYHNL